MAERENIWRRRGGPSSWKATCKNLQHWRHFERLSLEVISWIFHVEKLNGCPMYWRWSGGCCGRFFKKNALDFLPHPLILRSGPSQKGVASTLLHFWRVPLKSTRSYSLGYAMLFCGSVLSLAAHRNSFRGGEWNTGAGQGADKPGRFCKVTGDPSSQRGRPAHSPVSTTPPCVDLFSPPPGEPCGKRQFLATRIAWQTLNKHAPSQGRDAFNRFW